MRSDSGWAVGFTAFAAIMMALMGFFQASMGIVAIFNQDFYVTTPNYVFAFDVGTWGWIHLILGVLVLAAGLSLLAGATWARAVGVVLAAFSAIEAFVFIPYQPFWSIIVIAVCVMVIWALTTQTEDVIDEGSTADSGM
ncbi:MAG TPA: hypothetical protein VNN15_00685 [Solirubrobacterales bacterium]|nr:hypothetical protein [Solirubrobacterales bacterium]